MCFKLYRVTGDVRYAELIRDIQHAHVEATEMPGHPTCGTGDGASMERIQPTDAEGRRAIGNFVHTQNAWTELDGLMMVTELPGIYLQTDADKFFVFDHVEAKIVRRDGTCVTLTVSNPTSIPHGWRFSPSRQHKRSNPWSTRHTCAGRVSLWRPERQTLGLCQPPANQEPLAIGASLEATYFT